MRAPALLMIAFEFPPLDVVGVRRSVSLTRYLPEFGITPAVLTTDRRSLAQWFGNRLSPDDSAADAKVFRIPCPLPDAPPNDLIRPMWHFLSLGGDIGTSWKETVSEQWDAIVHDVQPRAIYVSLPPHRVAPLAVDLARRSRLPLVLDFRDHWSQWGDQAFPTRLHYQRELEAERECLDSARAVIGVTGQLVRDLQHAHPRIDPAKFHVVANGWDDREAPAPAATTRSAEQPFTIGHAGRFYYSPEKRASIMAPWWSKPLTRWPQYVPRREDWLYRSPYFFFRALRRLLDRRPELERRIKVQLAGDVEGWLAGQIAEFRLHHVVELLGRLSHDACLAFEAQCDALLVTSAKVEGGRDYCIAGKTFEYLAMRRPILGIVTKGEQQDFLRAAGGAVIADADDVDAGAAAIERLVEGAAIPMRNEAFIKAHHRREMAGKIAAIVREVAA